MTKRIAFARVQTESNALSPVDTTLADFRRTHFIEGEALLRACGPREYEVKGFLRNAELSGFVRAARRRPDQVELVPLLSAWAVSGGPVSAEAWSELKGRLLRGLQEAGPLDGLMLATHGALCVRGERDPEGELLRELRQILPDHAQLAVTMDLHANLTPAKVAGGTLIRGYRTNPHRDHARTGQRAGELLMGALLGEVRPVSAWRSLPLVLGGGNNLDFLLPMRPLYRWMKRVERDPRVLSVNLFNCHLWLDHPDMGWSTYVLTDDAPELAEELAEELADRCWAVRRPQPPVFPGPSEAITQARRASVARRLGAVLMSDASDMVGAGGTGANTQLLAALLTEGGDLEVLLPLRDPDAVQVLWSEEPGAAVQLEVGGLDPCSAPLAVSGVLRSAHQTENFGRVVVLTLGRLQLVLTEGAALVMQPQFYSDLGLSPWRADVVVVKSLFPFRIYFWRQNRKTIYVKTEGITDFDAGLRQGHFADPVWPLDEVEDWRPVDRRRRA